MSNTPLDLGKMKLATRAVHAGERIDLGNATPTVNGLFFGTAFRYPETEELDEIFADNSRGYVYSRHGSPNLRAFEQAIASLEEAGGAVAFPSGMAAINASLSHALKPGAHLLASRDIYGAVFGTLNTFFKKFGVTTTYVDITDLNEVLRVARATRPAAILLESISNPLIRVADVASVAAIAHEVGALLIVDNTFATPIITQPIKLGADMVVHSTTKFVSGHGDTTGGVIAASSELTPIIREEARISGAIPGPFDAWLSLRGLKTLPLRFREQSRNAALVAKWLAGDPRVSQLNYPGYNGPLPLAQFSGEERGAMLSFEIANAGRAEVFRFLDSLNLIQSATTLGDVYTMALYPVISSHRGYTAEERAEIGLSDGLVRLSVGIEAIEDILSDLDHALTQATSPV